MPRTKSHGYKRKHLFKVGDLVRWNRWHQTDIRAYGENGLACWYKVKRSHLGIVLRVYQSAGTRCWTADVKFSDPKLDNDYWGLDGRPIPLNCLEVT
jgi:hypothetical protein